MLKKLGLTSVMLLSAGAAHAQSMPAGFYMDGYVQGEYITGSGDGEFVYGIDVTLGYSGANTGSMPIGFELDLYAIDSDGFNVDPVVLGSVFYDSSFGRISIGKPDSPLDDYIARPSFGNSMLFNLFPGYYFGSYFNLLVLDGGSNNYQYGARFDGQMGNFEYGISYHDFQDANYSIAAAGRYRFADYYTAAFGVEYLDNGSASDTKYSASLEADYGQFGGQMTITNFESTTLYSIRASYEVMQNLELSAEYIDFPFGEMATIGAEYSFMDHGYVGASALMPSGSVDPIYNIYAGWKLNYGG
ncbi:MAG: porin [Paracoccaceae bacterium]